MGDDVRLPGAFEPTVFRIVQEALNNVRKHSQAHNVDVVIEFGTNSVEATVRDDGVGFDVAATEARLDQGKNLGMVSMRERVDLEKGRIDIRSQIGKGTEVHVSFDY
jgi:two-component system sensor histidine kinase DegS